jgi:hypothetical protein
MGILYIMWVCQSEIHSMGVSNKGIQNVCVAEVDITKQYFVISGKKLILIRLLFPESANFFL